MRLGGVHTVQSYRTVVSRTASTLVEKPNCFPQALATLTPDSGKLLKEANVVSLCARQSRTTPPSGRYVATCLIEKLFAINWLSMRMLARVCNGSRGRVSSSCAAHARRCCSSFLAVSKT